MIIHSRFTKKRSLLVVLLLAALMLSAGLRTQQTHGQEVKKISPPPTKYQPQKKPDLSQAVKAIIDQTNAFRKEEDREPVKSDPELTRAAKYFADFMARDNLYGHTADDKQPAERAREHGYDYCIVTENIAYQFNSQGFETRELAKKFVQGWKDSPGHRKNMLDQDVNQTGVAIAHSEETGHFFAVQMFGRPKADAIKFEISNQSKVEIQYKIGDQNFPLPPKFTRTHQQCRASEVNFQWPDEAKGPSSIRPASGDQLVITRDQAGEFEVKKK